MKICAISEDKKFLKIGADFDSARWFGFPDSLAATISTIIRGDIVEITHSQQTNGKLILDSIKKTGSAVASQKTYGKTPEEQDSIKRQAIGHMTSRTLIALQGQVNPDNIEDIMVRLYKKYQILVG